MTFSQFEEQITPGTSNLQPGTVHSVATPYPTASWLQLFVLSGSAQPCARAHHSATNISVQSNPPGLKPGHSAVPTHAMGNQFIHFDILAEYSPVSRKETGSYAFINKSIWGQVSMLPKTCHFFCMSLTPISVRMNTWSAHFQTYRLTVRFSTQNLDHVSLLNCHDLPLIREKYPSLHCHTLFVSLLLAVCSLVNNCFQRWSTEKNKISSKVSNEHLESSLRIVDTSTEADISVTNKKVTYPNSFMVLLLSFFNKKY